MKIPDRQKNKRKNIYEFLLWANCGNNCKFCWQKHLNQKDKFLNEQQKLDSLRAVKRFLSSNEYENGNHVLLVGGELFDTKKTPDFCSFLEFVIDKDFRGHGFGKMLINELKKICKENACIHI